MSASTAVLLSASIGISPVFRYFSWRLNSLEIRKASCWVGTASTFLYGVFMVFPSRVIT